MSTTLSKILNSNSSTPVMVRVLDAYDEYRNLKIELAEAGRVGDASREIDLQDRLNSEFYPWSAAFAALEEVEEEFKS